MSKRNEGRSRKSKRHGNQAIGGRGFSLIELLVAVAVIGILAAIAIPSYSAYAIRGQRAAAKAVLLQTAQAMERAYTTAGAYPAALPVVGGNACVALAPMDATTTTYCVAVAPPASAGGFLLTATPCGDAGAGCPATANLSFQDAQCDVLTLDNTGKKDAPAAVIPVDQCWQR